MGTRGTARKTVVIDVVGLTPEFLGANTPALAEFARRGRMACIREAAPAVTCTAQATYLTGLYPDRHGIVANGWYFRDECEVRFWRQSHKLVQAPTIWELARAEDPAVTSANLFGWYNMYSPVTYSVTPRPMYPADGRKIPDIYTSPAGLRHELQQKLGTFPLFDFWGPRAGIRSSEWIAEAAMIVDAKFDPTLTFIYVPHLDYNLQRLGPAHPAIQEDLAAVDAVCGRLLRHYEAREAQVVVLSEYGIAAVDQPVHINRELRRRGMAAVREELGLELLDAGASTAFAVSDHQAAHVYVNDPTEVSRVRGYLEALPGVASVLDRNEQKRLRLDHPRSGELVALAQPGAWFTYYYWLDDQRAPDFARTVDIHRKPGYDPVELFLDPAIRFPKLKIAAKLAKKTVGMRCLMDVIPLDATLVRGSHGRPARSAAEGPLLIANSAGLFDSQVLEAGDVASVVLRALLPKREHGRLAGCGAA